MTRRSDYVKWDEFKESALIRAVDEGTAIKWLSRAVGISSDRCVIRIRDLGLQNEYRNNRERRGAGHKRPLSPQTDAWNRLKF